MLLFNQLCVLIAFAATVSAFSVPMIASSVGRRRTAFASSSVYMSDAETASPELTSEEKASETAFPELTAEESAAKRKVQRDRHTMFVGNLPFETSETDIKSMFEPHGKVELVNIPRDRLTQKPRGFAFVDMGSAEELEAAIAAVDGSTFESRQVRVTKSLAKGEIDPTSKPKPKREKTDNSPPPGTKKIYIGNIPFTATKDEIKAFYSEFGDVVDVYIPPNPETGEGRGFAFATMAIADADKAIEGTNGAEFGGRTLVVNDPLPPGKKMASRRAGRTKLYVGNLSFYTVKETLEDIFGEFGEVIDCYIPEDPSRGGSRGFGFVTMPTGDALRAVEEVDGCEVDGRVIRVNEAQPKGRSGGGGGGGEQNNDQMGDEELGVISGSWDEVNDQ